MANEYQPPDTLRPYNGIPRSQIDPVFRTAMRLRHSDPQIRQVIELTQTSLEPCVVSSIIEGVLRLLPPEQNPAKEAARQQKYQARAAQASQAEQDFVNKVRMIDKDFMDERQQKQMISNSRRGGERVVQRATPDILFRNPTIINGVVCHWIEYKDTFGFKSDPFIYKKNRKQYRKYAAAFGSGMVVYSRGYQTDLLQIEGVSCVREAEVTRWINDQLAPR